MTSSRQKSSRKAPCRAWRTLMTRHGSWASAQSTMTEISVRLKADGALRLDRAPLTYRCCYYCCSRCFDVQKIGALTVHQDTLRSHRLQFCLFEPQVAASFEKPNHARPCCHVSALEDKPKRRELHVTLCFGSPCPSLCPFRVLQQSSPEFFLVPPPTIPRGLPIEAQQPFDVLPRVDPDALGQFPCPVSPAAAATVGVRRAPSPQAGVIPCSAD